MKPNRRIEKRPIRWGRVALLLLVVGALPALWLLRPAPFAGGELVAVASDEGLPGGGGDGGGSQEEEAPPPPPPAPGALPARVEVRTEAHTLPLEPGDQPTRLPLDVSFELRSDHAFPDLRLRLFDEAQRLVPGEESAVVGEGTRATLRPGAPLIPGTTYKLVVDGQAGRELVDAAGERFAPEIFSFRTEGEKPPPPPARRRGRR